MHNRLSDAQEKLVKVEDKQMIIDERIALAVNKHDCLERRLQRLRNLPAYQKKPLSRAERDFKSELGNRPILLHQ